MISQTFGCSKPRLGEPDPGTLSPHTLVFGSDVFLGQGFSQAVYDPSAWADIFGNVSPILDQADVSFVNAEGVISGGGLFAFKEDRFPLSYRVHPNAAKMLAEAGVDIVNVGNNHSGDYGTDAFVEELDRLSHEGIDYTGGGYTLEDARTPSVRVIGDTGLAIVGADLTFTESFAARWNTPGSLFFGLAHIGRNQDETVDGLERILTKARTKANVVLFSPHWGNNWQKKPTPHLRALAKRLMEVGYDGILGHSAHLIQGVELIDGKPVIYDAGNLVLNYGPSKGDHGEHRSLLYEIEFTKAGIKRLIAHPLSLGRNQTRLASKDTARKILEDLQELSKEMRTDVVIENGVGVIHCAPGDIFGPKTPMPLRKEPRAEIREAPSHIVTDKLPQNARAVNVRFENGAKLVGYRLMTDTLPKTASAQVIETYWTTEQKIADDPLIHMEAVGLDRSSKPETNFAGHQPGDWMIPMSSWPQGKIIRDITYFRVTLAPQGTVKFYTGIWNGRMMPAVSDDASVSIEENRILIGQSSFDDRAPKVYDLFSRLRRELQKD